jgi:phage terminase small subunit
MDLAAGAAYCQAYGEWVLIESKIKTELKKHGVDALIDITGSGYKQVAVMVQLRDRSVDRMLRFAKEFGMTPASRIQSTAGQQLALPGVPDDPMESFLNAAQSLPAVH